MPNGSSAAVRTASPRVHGEPAYQWPRLGAAMIPSPASGMATRLSSSASSVATSATHATTVGPIDSPSAVVSLSSSSGGGGAAACGSADCAAALPAIASTSAIVTIDLMVASATRGAPDAI